MSDRFVPSGAFGRGFPMCGFPAKRLALAEAAPLLAGALLALSCGGGEGGARVSPATPSAGPARQLTGLEVIAERTAIRVGQVVGPLVVYGLYDDGTTGTVTAAWSSSAPRVAEVAADGIVTGVAEGEAEITASFEGRTEALLFEVEEPNLRSTVDRPDDFDGPQIHVVYALPSDIEDGNLDRWGDIATSFEAIQNWLAADIGRRLRLDTYRGELDVTFLRLPFTHQEGDGQSGSLVWDIELAIARNLGVSDNKIYAVYYAGRSAGVCGSAGLGGKVGAVYVHREGCSNSAPGMDPEEASTYEAVMVHELLHVFGAVPTCAPHQGQGAHVVDDTEDVMYAGLERGARSEAVLDVGRDDYYGHGRADCLDTADSPYWEPVLSGAARSRSETRIRIPAGDFPIRCGLH